jgi:hypothetical protein
VLATGPKGCRFKPGRGGGFFRAVKICSTLSFGWEVKLEVPCLQILWYIKRSLEVFQVLIGKFSILRPFFLLAPDVSANRTARAVVDESGVIPSWHHHHHGSPYSHITQEMNNRPIGGCSSET